MQCENFETRIHELLDQRRPFHDARLNEHAEDCAKCRETLAGYESLLLGLDLGTPGLDEDFAERVCREALTAQPDNNSVARDSVAPTLADPPQTRSSWTIAMQLAGAGGVVAVAILLLVTLLPYLAGPSSDPEAPPIANQSPSTPATHELAGNETGNEAGDDRVDLPPDVVVSLDEALTSERLRGALQDWAARFPADRAAEGLDSVESIARPITSSFSIAIGALRKTIPVGREPATPGKPQADASNPNRMLLG